MKKIILLIAISCLALTLTASAKPLKYPCYDMDGGYFADATYYPETKMAYVYTPDGNYEGYISLSSKPYGYYTYTDEGPNTEGGSELQMMAYVYLENKSFKFKFVVEEDLISP